MVLDTEYIGTKGTHLGILENPNRSISSIANSALQINNATSFSYQTEGANSHYNAAQVRLTRRLSRSVSANTLYTFAKGIDDASSFNGTGGTVVQFLDNRALERGLSTFDVRHNLNAGFQLSSPVGVRGLLRNGGWKTQLLRSWNMNGNFNVTTGTPLTAKISGNLANTGGLAGGGSLRARSDGAADRGAGRYVLQHAGVHHAAGRPVRQRGPEHDSGAVPCHDQFQFESLLPLPGEPAHADVFGECDERAQSRDHHQHRDHGQLVELRPAGRGVGDAGPHAQFAVQFLRYMRNKMRTSSISRQLLRSLTVAARIAAAAHQRPSAHALGGACSSRFCLRV